MFWDVFHGTRTTAENSNDFQEVSQVYDQTRMQETRGLASDPADFSINFDLKYKKINLNLLLKRLQRFRFLVLIIFAFNIEIIQM